jgi:hypothetical protein
VYKRQGNRILISNDGINWSTTNAPLNTYWGNITYGNGLFVAVEGNVGTTTPKVMTSIDGINWSMGVSAGKCNWNSVTYGNGLFIAVANNGPIKVMTSIDGLIWVPENEAATKTNNWVSVAYGNNLFVAVSRIGGSNGAITATTMTPTLTNFIIPNKIYGSSPFRIMQPNSNSSGLFNYTSSNLLVATISGDIITIVGIGISTITATQSKTQDYAPGIIQQTINTSQPILIKPDDEHNTSNLSSTYGYINNYYHISLGSNYHPNNAMLSRVSKFINNLNDTVNHH